MPQIYELCRLCAQKKRNKFDLFTEHNSEEANILLAKISICVSIRVTLEDHLPKMICFDCQKSIELFNSFRVKCQKAEEKLQRMISVASTNKIAVTKIKEEHFETEFEENLEIEDDMQGGFEESLSSINLKSVKNLKCEIDEESEFQHNDENEAETSDLIQIISEEIVSRQCVEDVKQPQIEIISEEFDDKFKAMYGVENNEFCEMKLIPETILKLGEDANIHPDSSMTLTDFEVNPYGISNGREPAFQNGQESIFDNDNLKTQQLVLNPKCVDNQLKPKRKYIRKKKSKDMANGECQIDEKYLTLADGEVCNIDVEEIEAAIKKKVDPNAKFNCDKCNKSFKSFKCLRKHKHWHNSQPDIFICEICKKENIKNFEFVSLKTLNCHIQRKHMPQRQNKFECLICHKLMESQGLLNAHFKKIHDNSGAHCQTCGKVFKNKVRLKSHLVVHQDKRPYICEQCGQSFKWSNGLKVHMQWHKQEKNYLCSECGKKFAAKKNLVEHLNIHAGKRPFVCEHCQASFVQLAAYTKHLYLHNENLKIHKCHKCDKTYSHAYMLRQHMLRHTGLRPYKCVTCSSSFQSATDLWCHSKTHQEKQYGCQVCGKKFALSKTLRDHMVLHTGIKHICPVPGCGKTYTQRFPLTKHFYREHPSLSIIGRKGGRRTCSGEKSSPDPDANCGEFIRYDFKEKDELL